MPLHFFLTYEWAQEARGLSNTRQERFVSDKHSNLLGPFVSYKEKRVVNAASVAYPLRGLPFRYY